MSGPAPGAGRDGRSLKQLGEVSQVRHLRLRRQREALAERERSWDQAMQRQLEDEQLLQVQQAATHQRWQAWRERGGALAAALQLRADREQLAEVARLLAQRREALQLRRHQLADELSAWARRWQAAQTLDEVIERRQMHLHRASDGAAERQRDEDAVLCRPLAGLARARFGVGQGVAT